MNHIFADVLHHFVAVFFDDILVNSATKGEHLQNLPQVFEISSKYRFYLQAMKYNFGQESIKYLGHIVSAGVVRSDSKKLRLFVLGQYQQLWSNCEDFWGSQVTIGGLSGCMLASHHHLPIYCGKILLLDWGSNNSVWATKAGNGECTGMAATRFWSRICGRVGCFPNTHRGSVISKRTSNCIFQQKGVCPIAGVVHIH